MMPALSNEDRALLAAIAAAADEIDPVPLDVLANARASLTWLDIDAELAALVEDSALTPAGVRSAVASRLLVFAAGKLEIDIEVTATGETRRLIGQISPPGTGQLEVRHSVAGPSIQAEIDDLGRFIADGVRPGLVSLCVRLPGGAVPTVTSWVTI